MCTVVKSKMKISQNFVAFSEYMNFMIIVYDESLPDKSKTFDWHKDI